MFIGVDIGGTHTDIVAYDEENEAVRSVKTESTPGAFKRGVINGLSDLAEQLEISLEELLGEELQLLSHGTTVGTNALLTRAGVETGLVTTEGFEDNYSMARMKRGGTTNLCETHRPEVLIPREKTVGIAERIDSQGDTVIPVNENEIRQRVQTLVEDHGVESIAVSFLWSPVNPAHEELVQEIIEEEYPDTFVSISSEISPSIGEFERTNTVVTNSYISPIVEEYISELEDELRERGLEIPLYLMASDGGTSTTDIIKEEGVATLYSGPAAGVVGVEQIYGEQLENIITLDMGGTSTDVGLIENSELLTKEQEEIDRLPISKVMVDVTSVGAGGGSVAWIDEGILRVGPQSQGANPGPACYGNSDVPTVTDADLVLGYLNPDRYLGGRTNISESRARNAITSDIAEQLDRDVAESARGIYRIVNSVMADAIREVTVNRGYDPREFALAAFGGAAGVHCTAVAAEMDISRVVIPPAATSFSALGLLTAELDYTVSQSERIRIPDLDHIDDNTVHEINEIITSLDDQAADAFTDVDEENLEMARHAFVGYRNQSLEVEVSLPDPPLNAADVSSVINQFMQRFNRIYGEGSAHKQGGVVFKTFQSEAIVRDMSRPNFDTEVEAPNTPGEDAYRTTREAFDRQSGMLVDMDVYDGTALDPGTAITGPSILEYPGTTVVLHASDRAKVDALGGIEITVMEGDQ